MTFAGFLVFAIGVMCYFSTWKSIRQLVVEANTISPNTSYSWFWWMPALKPHKKAYPSSSLRRTIALKYVLSFALLIIAASLLMSPLIRNRLAGSTL